MISPRREKLPFLHLLPSLVTIIGLCAGLTAIRFAYAEKYALAVLLVLVAAALDGVDGLLARRLNSVSPFGAELDSLCDFLDFGVAPGIIVYQFALADAVDLGWVLVLVYIVCCCLRLARFNVNRDAPTGGAVPRFVGVPAPAGALLALLPMFATFAGLWDARDLPALVAPWLGLVGLLMVSRLPTFSPKAIRIPRDKVRFLLIGTAIVVGLAATRFWLLMVLVALAYVATLIHAAIRLRGTTARGGDDPRDGPGEGPDPNPENEDKTIRG
ncbi:CDP-alcohol phosphatidyltransferase family protein [Amaricoccus solimangrovi]|uniref:CDP-diacylglycerol--serine O-phosphatidyltransferase n=1 Tax=Amaricoccus solimangrovi TaxID=2589815 RepID=A0A501WY76_9RHOB|nr:CDP-alcohol phosphatidyltransferase family protein [Amaricoccus solimangrovi]TPE52477.1 CDP-diacylglycerol--serine O-phosphatidyltransferase [Amaricoccus solimangrovi]